MTTNVYPSTVGPILKGKLIDSSIGIWLRGKGRNNYHTFGVVKLDNQDIKFFELVRTNDYIHLFNYDDLEYGPHQYKVGYFYSQNHNLEELLSEKPLDWSNTNTYTFNINNKTPLNFVVGSCRRLIRFGGINFAGTGEEGDRIFRAIHSQKRLDFVLNIGDKVYFDPTNVFKQYKTLKQKRKLYRRVYNFPEQRSLYQEIPGYDICDDHDLQKNNTGQATRQNNPITFNDGLKAYQEYQHWMGPADSIGAPLYYSFKRKGAHFFIMDTRSERCELDKPPLILSDKQEQDFKVWLQDPSKNGSYKFIITSVPLLSQKEHDSWAAFVQQQRRILELICGKDEDGYDLDKVIIITGDAHCARVGVYSVFVTDTVEANLKEKQILIGKIPEVLSSGLVAINHDQGKILTRYTDITNYDNNNNFPYIIDNSSKGGLKIVTSFSSSCYPNPSRPNGPRQKFKALFDRVVDNVFIRIHEIKVPIHNSQTKNKLNNNQEFIIVEDQTKLEIQIINQDNVILHSMIL